MTASPFLRPPPLRTVVLAATGQDVRQCQNCACCDIIDCDDLDLAIYELVQMVIMNDERVLTSRTVWSDAVFQAAQKICVYDLDVQPVILALRNEARRRGLTRVQ